MNIRFKCRYSARNGQSSFSPIADRQDLYPTFLVVATRARFMLGRNVEDHHGHRRVAGD